MNNNNKNTTATTITSLSVMGTKYINVRGMQMVSLILAVIVQDLLFMFKSIKLECS